MSDEKLFYRISEVAKKMGVTQSTLRFWEKQIPKLKPRTNAKGNRLYTKEDIAKLEKVRFLIKDKGHTVAGAKNQLSTNIDLVAAKSEISEKLIKLRSFLELLSEKIGD